MSNYNDKLKQFGVKIPEILLPANKDELNKWAVIACDQYTSQKEYWQNVDDIASGSPSTINLIYPECYLEEPSPEVRINNINNTMNEYISSGVFSPPVNGFILLKRDTPKTSNRWGLMAALDLEEYDFSPDSKSMIRATEGTIIERIPPRVRIRKNAALELPHIMVLIDDPGKTVIEPLAARKEKLEKVYDFDLMMNSGHLTGYLVKQEEQLNRLADAIAALGSAENLSSRYNSERAFLFAMGDGNHSLATAKTIWENYKKEHADEPDLMNHPSRWALVEIVNIFSEGIEFEAIHRAVFNCSPRLFISELKENPDFRVSTTDSLEKVMDEVDNAGPRQLCGYCTEDEYGIIEALKPDSSIIAGTIQNYIDNYLKSKQDAVVDYIHGIDVTDELGRKPGNMGIFLPAISKETFFQTVINDGAFPRKTFSMGEAFEKRFYVEARKIR